VDLGGYTSDTRTAIFAHRPAPLQVNYLGYPGSMGADYMDYILADRFIIPPEDQPYFTEKVAYLPHTYLPTDAGIKISERMPTREEYGLPPSGAIFCSFNHDYKINPPVFEAWMNILKQTPGSVLWLMARNELIKSNLRKEASKRGVDPDRLVFATRVPKVEDHLARYRLADLFLDTTPYNAHTTAADALMAGLPVITYMGHAFPGRVASGLVNAIGLPELVTHSLEEYQQLAIELANDQNKLAALKDKLQHNKKTYPLFNTRQFCRDVEEAWTTMWRRYQNGKAPASFMVGVDQEAEPDLSAADSTPARVTPPAPPTLPDTAVDGGNWLHIGGRQVKPGWKILNAIPGEGVDYIGDIRDLSQFADESFDQIYGSHIIEHLSQQEIVPTLQGLCRILKKGGKLMVSVPNLETLCRMFLDPNLDINARYHVMRMIFGGQTDDYDYHYIGLNMEFLFNFLRQAGFNDIYQVGEFGLFDDTSSYKPYGVPISLNMVAIK
jgi:predicted SAM-dependent methyltransferase